jgi:ABC-type multidrug transport system fused ATPase/permease subunit
LSGKRRRQLWLTFALMGIGTAAEIVTIGAVIPFLSVLMAGGGDGGRIEQFQWLPIASSTLTGTLLLLSVATAGSAALRVLLLWTSQSAVAGVGNDLSKAVFGRALIRPYSEQVRHHSSITLSMVEQVHRTSSSTLLPAMQALTSSVIAASVIAFLLFIQPVATLVGGGAVALLYFLVGRLSRPALHRNGRILTETARSRTRSIQDAAGGIRDIILDHSHSAVTARFGSIDRAFRRAQTINSFLSLAPRFIVEACGVMGLAVTAVVIAVSTDDFAGAVPSLGALALGAQRLLPLLQQAYGGWSQAVGNLHALDEVVNMLGLPAEETSAAAAAAPVAFRQIRFDDVEFAYPTGGKVLHGASLTLVAGEHLAIIGPTGHGKSTLLDLLLGLMEPTAGLFGWTTDRSLQNGSWIGARA